MSRNSILSNAIKENIPILEYAQKMGYTPERCGNQYTLKEHDSVRINTERNVYYRHSTETGGSIIDFVMEFEELTQDEAIRKLRGMLTPASRAVMPSRATPQKTPEPHKKLLLPKAHNGRFSRVFAYLTKSRGIDSEIVAAIDDAQYARAAELYMQISDRPDNLLDDSLTRCQRANIYVGKEFQEMYRGFMQAQGMDMSMLGTQVAQNFIQDLS